MFYLKQVVFSLHLLYKACLLKKSIQLKLVLKFFDGTTQTKLGYSLLLWKSRLLVMIYSVLYH